MLIGFSAVISQSRVWPFFKAPEDWSVWRCFDMPAYLGMAESACLLPSERKLQHEVHQL